MGAAAWPRVRVGGLAGPNAPSPCHDSRNACATQHAAKKIRESAAAGHWPGPREGREGAGVALLTVRAPMKNSRWRRT